MIASNCSDIEADGYVTEAMGSQPLDAELANTTLFGHRHCSGGWPIQVRGTGLHLTEDVHVAVEHDEVEFPGR